MKSIQNQLFLIFSLLFISPNLTNAQDNTDFKLICEINRVYPPLSMTKTDFGMVDSLIHLNPNFKTDWVKEYTSVEVLAVVDGETKKSLNKNDLLTDAQKKIIKSADDGTEILVKVRYLPNNNLGDNDIKEMDFKVFVDPNNDAKFPGGEQELNKYLKDNFYSKMDKAVFKEHQLSAVTFAVNEKGEVIDPNLFWATEDEKMDELLMETICNMPNWKPAEYTNGLKVKQEFAFMVGDKKSCMRNLINIRQPWLGEE